MQEFDGIFVKSPLASTNVVTLLMQFYYCSWSLQCGTMLHELYCVQYTFSVNLLDLATEI